MTDYETPCKHGYWRECSECDVQAAIDAALESVADLLDSGDDWNTGDEIAEFIRSRIGTNPLAERDARIAELERELAEARKACNVAGPEFNELYKDLKGF